MSASMNTDLRLCAVGGARASGAMLPFLGILTGPSKLAVPVCVAPDPRPAWRCPRLETCGFATLPKTQEPSERAYYLVEPPSQEMKLVSCPCPRRVRQSSLLTDDQTATGPGGLVRPNCSGREKHSSHGASRVFDQETGPSGEGPSPFRRRNRQIGSDHRQAADVTSWQGRRGPSRGFVPSYWRVGGREKSRSPSVSKRQFWDPSVPSGAVGLAANVVGLAGSRSRAVSNLQLPSRAGRSGSWRGGAQSTARPMDGLGLQHPGSGSLVGHTPPPQHAGIGFLQV